jgi:hypothetical protein
MKVKVSEATGHVLDWMVAKADNREVLSTICQKVYVADRSDGLSWLYGPSKWWAEGGPIIEREGIGVYRECLREYPDYRPVPGATWEAIAGLYLVGDHEAQGAHGSAAEQGPTPLIAAMRCFVASRLGDEVDVPEELAC